MGAIKDGPNFCISDNGRIVVTSESVASYREPIDLAAIEPEFTFDPYPFYDGMRNEAPIRKAIHFGLPVWYVTGYEEARQLLADPRLKHNRSHATPESREKGPWLFMSEQLGFSRFMLALDAPDHTRLRNMINKVFTPRRVDEMRPWIERCVDQAFVKFLPKGHSRWMDEIAYPVPMATIGHLLGIPPTDKPDVRLWTDAFGSSRSDIGKMVTGYQNMTDYFEDLIARKRKHQDAGRKPESDLLTALILARDEEDALNDNELLGMCAQIVLAGFETTANLLSNGLLALTRRPDQQAELKANPELLKNVGDEMVRYEAPVKHPWFRFAVQDISIGDVVIPTGSVVAINLAAANRCPAQFKDPDQFDVHRDASSHLAFSRGPHFCFGAPLGKVEAEIVFKALLKYCDDITLAGEPIGYRPSATMRALIDIEIDFTLTPEGCKLVEQNRSR
jgi:cytochrome P450